MRTRDTTSAITELEHQQIQLLFQQQKIAPTVYEAVA